MPFAIDPVCGADVDPESSGWEATVNGISFHFCAEECAAEYMSNYFLSIVNHYELMSEHFKEVKGYDHYAKSRDLFAEVGLETAVKAYCDVQTWGTPAQILDKLNRRRELLGDFELNLIVNYGGMTFEEADSSLRLFAKEVLPELQRA